MKKTNRLFLVMVAMGIVLISGLLVYFMFRSGSGDGRHVNPEIAAQRPESNPINANAASQKGQQAVTVGLADWMELPKLSLGDFDTMSTQEHVKYMNAVDETIKSALSMDTEKAALAYRAFIDKYPLAPDTPPMMARLALMQARMGQFDEARKTLEAAKLILGKDRYINIIDINIGYLNLAAKDDKAAERLFQDIMGRPIPKKLADPYAVIPQLFISREGLSAVYEKRGDFDGAERQLMDMATEAEKLTQQLPDQEWPVSYLAMAYRRRISLLKSSDPTATARGRTLLTELTKRLTDAKVDPDSGSLGILLSDIRSDVFDWEMGSRAGSAK